MDSLIDLGGSPPKDPVAPLISGLPAEGTRLPPNVDLFEASVHDEVALASCPVLSLGASDQESEPAASTHREQDIQERSETGSPFQVVKKEEAIVPAATGPDSGSSAKEGPSEGTNPANADLPMTQSTSTPTVSQPAKLELIIPPGILFRDLARRWRRTVYPGQQAHNGEPVIIHFIVSENPDLAEGVFEAAYRELAPKTPLGTTELMNFPDGRSYLRITADTKKDAIELLRVAQDVVDDLLLDRADTRRGLFLEPPRGVPKNFRVALAINPDNKNARACLELQDGTEAPKLDQHIQKYTDSLKQTLCDALKKEGRLNERVSLRIQLGHYMMQRYIDGRYGLEEFEAMIKDPRASGRLETRNTSPHFARGLLKFIQDSNTLFIPTDSQAPTSADVVPEYFFEACSDTTRLEAKLVEDVAAKRRKPDAPVYRVQRPRAFQRTMKMPDLDITNVTLGKGFDWKVEVVVEEPHPEGLFQNVNQYFRSANVDMEGDLTNFAIFPHISLSRNHRLATAFKSVAVKNIYRFYWKATPYIVEVSINRQWGSITNMTDQKDRTGSVGISIYGEAWDEETRVPEKGTTVNMWGDELEHLFREDDPASNADTLQRVEDFLETVREICDALEGVRVPSSNPSVQTQ